MRNLDLEKSEIKIKDGKPGICFRLFPGMAEARQGNYRKWIEGTVFTRLSPGIFAKQKPDR